MCTIDFLIIIIIPPLHPFLVPDKKCGTRDLEHFYGRLALKLHGCRHHCKMTNTFMMHLRYSWSPANAQLNCAFVALTLLLNMCFVMHAQKVGINQL